MTTTEITYNAEEFKQAIIEAYEQFAADNPKIPDEDAPGEAAFWVMEGNFTLPEPLGDTPIEAYTLPQYVYYLEAILTTPDLPLDSYISYHLIEDNYEIDGMMQDGLRNAIGVYVAAVKGFSSPTETEPVPDTELPTETPEDITDEFESIITEGSEITTTTEDEFTSESQTLQNLRRDEMKDWSLTKKAQFIDYLRDYSNVKVEIPDEQLHRRREPIEGIIEMALYWVYDNHLRKTIHQPESEQ